MKFYTEYRPLRTLMSREFRSQNLLRFLPQKDAISYINTFNVFCLAYAAPLGPTTPITLSVEEFFIRLRLLSFLPASLLPRAKRAKQ